MTLYNIYLKLAITLSFSLNAIFIFTKLQSKIGLERFLPREEKISNPTVWNKYTWYIVCLTVFFAALMMVMLSTTWPQGDEWLLMSCKESGLASSMYTANHHYYHWCSRISEILGITIGLSRNMWENRIITPIIISIIPFLSFILCAPRGARVSSREGFIFITASYSLLLLISPHYYSSYWVNVTYVWTAAATLVCLYLFRKCFSKTIYAYTFAFTVSLISGWSTECGSISIGLLLVLLMYEHYKKRTWSKLQTIVIIGYLTGCFMLYSSPAISSRSNSSHTLLATMDIAQVKDYVCNLSWEKVKALKGGAVVALLKDVPYHLRIYFWPYLMELYLAIAGPALIACGGMFCIAAGHLRNNGSIVLQSAILLFVSILCASLYLGGAIPHQASLYPAAFIAYIAFCYLFINIKTNHFLRFGVATLVLAFTLIQYIPGTVEALRLVPVRMQRDAEIDKQATLRREEIILPPIPEAKQKYNVITQAITINNNITDNKEAWVNINVARWIEASYGYTPKSVIQQKSDK